MMTEQQFEMRLKEIDAGYCQKREHADAYRDQEMGRLFEVCEWGQEKIARRMGKSQQWVSYRLVFGQFLSFTTTGGKADLVPDTLTERGFRKLHCNTRGKKEARFNEVLDKLTGDLPTGYKNMVGKPGFRKAVEEILADGKWYTIPEVHASLQERFPEADEPAAQNAIYQMLKKPPRGKELLSKRISKRNQYRLRSLVAAAVEEMRPAAVQSTITNIVEGIAPIISELKQWGTAHEFQMSPTAIRRLAAQLEKLFEPLMQSVNS